ncbi:sugar phosphate nucleotidyltransferase [Bizionia sediminis]|uniref:Sugar phosphate nucleotidyltransferase n=1 Tax=Bizionia sediminis TaxID=1737064 RepID=A0ABW5KRJ4_9FLAO
MAKKTLAIMAAGMGTRFGSLKQLHPVYNAFTLMDFSIFDALQAGYNHIVFIVRDDILNLFKERYTNWLPPNVRVDFVVQEANFPEVPLRKKPWGTGHALLALKNLILNKFSLINADDYYGKDAFKRMFKALYTETSNNHYLIGYPLKNTLSENGSVSRGICKTDANNKLISIEEHTQITAFNFNEIGNPEKQKQHLLNPESLASMNFWGFNPCVFDIAEPLFEVFKKQTTNIKQDEFYITYIIQALLNQSETSIMVLPTKAKWFGVTYAADEPIVRNHLIQQIAQNQYPKKLW